MIRYVKSVFPRILEILDQPTQPLYQMKGHHWHVYWSVHNRINQLDKLMSKSSMIIIQSIVSVLSVYLPSLSVWAGSWQDQTNNYEEELVSNWSGCRFWFWLSIVMLTNSWRLTFKQKTWEHQNVDHFVNWTPMVCKTFGFTLCKIRLSFIFRSFTFYQNLCTATIHN